MSIPHPYSLSSFLSKTKKRVLKPPTVIVDVTFPFNFCLEYFEALLFDA